MEQRYKLTPTWTPTWMVSVSVFVHLMKLLHPIVTKLLSPCQHVKISTFLKDLC